MNLAFALCFVPFVLSPKNSYIWRHGGYVGLLRQRNGGHIALSWQETADILDTKQRLDSYINEDGGCISMKTKEISHWEQFWENFIKHYKGHNNRVETQNNTITVGLNIWNNSEIFSKPYNDTKEWPLSLYYVL